MTRNRSEYFALCACLFLFALAIPLGAQEFRATIIGAITDQQGAMVPGATIKATNLATNVTLTATSNSAGAYVISYVPDGAYNLTVSAQGFKNSVHENLRLSVGDRVQQDFKLELGAITEQVTVSAAAVLLETTTGSRGQVIDYKKVADLPLLGRNPFLLVMETTGASLAFSGPQSTSFRPFDNGGMDGMTINGSGGQMNEFLLDGVTDSNTETGSQIQLSYVPPPDAVSEFRVQSSLYDAQYGRTGGGVISTSLKNGTNDLHGAAYWYFRNDKLNANDFLSNLNGVPRAGVRWAQPGVEVDGPIVIPRLYNGKNKTFFMFSWEKIKSSGPRPGSTTVPTLDQRSGDFSTTVQANGQPITIYDPLSTQQPSPGVYVRQPFAGARIPTSQIDPVATKIISYYPKPNSAGQVFGQVNNLVYSPNASTDNYDEFAFRLDQVINQKHRFFAHFVRGNRHEVLDKLGFAEKAATAQYTHWRTNHGGTFGLTSMLSPSLVNDFRANFIRHQFAIDRYAEGFNPAQLGFPQQLVSQLPTLFFPSIAIAGNYNLGSSGSVYTFSNTWQFGETLTKVIGSHSVKFGGEFRNWRNNWQNPTSSSGTYNFSNGFTQANPLVGDAASGNAVASFLLGYPASGNVQLNPALAYQEVYWAAYVHDDWRVSTKLTLNLGFRWDYESPMTERYNRQNAGFDTSSPSPFLAPGLNLKGGLLFTSASNHLPYQSNLTNFQPRFGIAYQINSKTVFRGGYGLVYQPMFEAGTNNGFSVSTAYVASNDGGITPANHLYNPFPANLIQPPGSSQGLATLIGQGFTYRYYNREVPRVHQFSAGFQRELPNNFILDASFVGSRTHEMFTSKAINDVSLSDYLQGAAWLNAQVPNPFQGLLPGTSFNGATVTRSQLLQPYPQFTGIIQGNRPIGRAGYNSLQLKVEKRFSRGLHVLASYTLSKNLVANGYLNGSYDPIGALQRTFVSYDQPQRFTLSLGYELPFFKDAHGFLKQALGGWQLNTIVTAESGFPTGAPGGVYSTGVDASVPNPTSARWFNTCTINLAGQRQNCTSASEPAAWIIQPAFTLRTLNSYFPNIRQGDPPNADVSLFKQFSLYERMRVQFRAEAFNFTNTARFGSPNIVPTSNAFGTVSFSSTNDPRNIQLGLKLLW